MRAIHLLLTLVAVAAPCVDGAEQTGPLLPGGIHSAESIRQARADYQSLIALFPEDKQGYGIDPNGDHTGHQPMTYGLILSAESIHLISEPNSESRNRVRKATEWLLKNQDLDMDGKPGWGLPSSWDAWSDGTTNPANQPYTITTAIVLNGLLDALLVKDLWSERERQEIQKLLIDVSRRWCQHVWSEGFGGGYFWYSPSRNDKIFGINAPVMFLGSIARLLAEHETVISEADRRLFQDRADQLAKATVATVSRRDGAPFWLYAPIPNRLHHNGGNDLIHHVYVLWGIETYRDCGGRIKLPWTRADALKSIDQFWRDGVPSKWPMNGSFSKTARPRMWSVGMMLGAYAKWGTREGPS